MNGIRLAHANAATKSAAGLSRGPPSSPRIAVTFTREEFATLKAEAIRRDKSISALIRSLCGAALRSVETPSSN